MKIILITFTLGGIALAQNVDPKFAVPTPPLSAAPFVPVEATCHEFVDHLGVPTTCIEIRASLKLQAGGLAYLEVGRGGQICGPVIFRDDAGNIVLNVPDGVCALTYKKKD